MEKKVEALRRTEHFRESRIPKFVEWLEEILVRTPDGEEYLGGSGVEIGTQDWYTRTKRPLDKLLILLM